MERLRKGKKAGEALAGLAAGLCGGLFGAGGGAVAVLALGRLGGLGEKEAHAGAIAATLPLAAGGALVYALEGAADWGALLWVAPGLALGSAAGAALTGRISPKGLRLAFACAALLAGGWMLL